MNTRNSLSPQRVALTAAMSLCLLQASTADAAITVSDSYHFLDNRSDNSVRIFAGVRQTIGALNVTPNPGSTPSAATQIIATQDGVHYTSLVYDPVTVAPNQYARSVGDGMLFFNAELGENVPYNPSTAGWSLFGRSDPTDAYAAVGTLPSIEGATVLPFVSNMRVSGSGEDMTFNWGVYEDSSHDSVRVQIWSLDYKPGDSISGDILFSRSFMAPDVSSFRIGDYADLGTLLSGDKMYSVEVSLIDRRDESAPVSNANILSRSRSFFDFMLLPEGAPDGVYLPSGGIDPTGDTVFKFAIERVTPDEIIFIDPIVAVGYDYAIGAGDPLIRAVLLPTGIGDSLYDIELWDGSAWVPFKTNILGGEELVFDDDGVDRFRVLGIETTAGLDPANPLAFITGLRFAEEGRFTGTMTPLTEFVAPVPEPGVLVLIAAGLLGWCLTRRAS
ncbi:PEP-CTERM sorting domain-containing protein [Thauera mechernichensis]